MGNMHVLIGRVRVATPGSAALLSPRNGACNLGQRASAARANGRTEAPEWIKRDSLAPTFAVGLLAVLAVVLVGCVVMPAKATITRSGEVQPASGGGATGLGRLGSDRSLLARLLPRYAEGPRRRHCRVRHAWSSRDSARGAPRFRGRLRSGGLRGQLATALSTETAIAVAYASRWPSEKLDHWTARTVLTAGFSNPIVARPIND